LIAFVVACHGFTYIPFGLLAPGKMKDWKGSSRLFGNVLAAERAHTLVPALHVLAGVTILACAVAIAFAPAVPGLWAPLAVLGSLAGLAGFAAFYDGRAGYVVREGAIGAAISLILLVTAIALPGVLS
jgi:hypothetical protein